MTMRKSKLMLFLLVGVFFLSAVSQMRRPQPLSPSELEALSGFVPEGYFRGEVATLISDPARGAAAVVIVRRDGIKTAPKKVLLIEVGGPEAAAIALALKGRSFVRPLTHDLLRQIIRKAGMKVGALYIHSLHKDTFFARLELKKNGRRISFDCRPSDGLALALRAKAPIWIEEKMFARAAMDLPADHPPISRAEDPDAARPSSL